MGWFAIKALGLPRYLWIALAIAAVIGLWLWVGAAERADDKANQEIGRTIEREGALVETLERTEKGNEAREEIGAAGPAGDRLRYDQCVRTARTPANCQRFLSDRQTDQR
jgi:hypothetical protein